MLLKNVKIDLREKSVLTPIVPGLRSAQAETLKPAVYTRANKNRYKMQDDFINPITTYAKAIMHLLLLAVFDFNLDFLLSLSLSSKRLSMD